jgi:hypothetical protein
MDVSRKESLNSARACIWLRNLPTRTIGLELYWLEPDGWKTPSFTSSQQSGSCRSHGRLLLSPWPRASREGLNCRRIVQFERDWYRARRARSLAGQV